ncbi:caspase family protein [Neorhizobium sp. DAR64860/K0K1]|uniref:caspase family protein n=1 Tax=Neorhizobium sp. DAR64860/K0K1 TaxID=3421955 RepID=UPI003D29DD3B
MKRALVVGIDDYPKHPLTGCVNDAIAMATVLETLGNGDPNFSVVTLTSQDYEVGSEALHEAVARLFSGDAETVLLYFAGHGIINRETNTGHIVAQDGRPGGWGMSLADILALANKAYPKIKSSVIILDSCHGGYAGEVAGLGNEDVSLIGTGVTILTASHREGIAEEGIKHGLFTEIILDGLRGGAADILGNVTPAALYSLVDQTLGPWGQRPIYKANVQTFVTLRQVAPKIPKEFLRELPTLFPDDASEFKLDPSFEPARDNVPSDIMEIPPNPENVRVFKGLQACNRNGLVVPVGCEHMYYAAIESRSCRLTAIGAHYRKLAESKRL